MPLAIIACDSSLFTRSKEKRFTGAIIVLEL
jgi:hypothetical protein